MKIFNKTFFTSGVIFLGFFLRFYNLSSQSLWWDEGYSFKLMQNYLHHGFAAFLGKSIEEEKYISTDNTQPLFHILAAQLPSSWSPEWRMRFISAIFSSLAILLFHYILQKLKIGYIHHIMTLFLFSCSPFLIYFAQEGRPYSFLLFLILSFIAILFNPVLLETFIGKFLCTLVVVLIGYTQFIGLILPFSFFFIKIVDKNTSLIIKINIIQIILITIIFLLPLGYLLWINRLGPIPINKYGFFSFPYSAFVFLVGFSLGPSLYQLHLDSSIKNWLQYWPILFYIFIIYNTLMYYGFRKLSKREDLKHWSYVPLILIIIYSAFLIFKMIPTYPRHMISLIPFLFISIALALQNMTKFKCWLMFIALTILFLFSDYNYFNNRKYYKEDMRAAANYVSLHEKDGDVIWVSIKEAFMPYYRGNNKIARLPIADSLFIYNLEANPGIRNWIILARKWEFDRYGFKERFLANHKKYSFDEKVLVFCYY